MIRHVVMYKLKEQSQNCSSKLEEMFQSMRGKIPVIRGLETGSDYVKSERSFDVVLITTFDNEEDFNCYLESEYQVNVVKPYVKKVVEQSKSVDYEF